MDENIINWKIRAKIIGMLKMDPAIIDFKAIFYNEKNLKPNEGVEIIMCNERSIE